MDMAHDHSSAGSGWQNSPPGTVVRLSEKLRKRRHRREFLRGAVAAAATFIGGGALGTFLASRGREREYDFGGITCSEVRKLVPRLKDRAVDMPTLAKIKTHVAACPNCVKLVEQMGGMKM